MEIHKLKVYEASSLINIPQIRLQGKWVEKAGFQIGKLIVVEVKSGEIRITLADEFIVDQE